MKRFLADVRFLLLVLWSDIEMYGAHIIIFLGQFYQYMFISNCVHFIVNAKSNLAVKNLGCM